MSGHARLDADEALLARSGRRAGAAALARRQPAKLDRLQQMMGLPAPVWENTTPNKYPDGRCVFFSGDRRCTATATHWAC